MLDFIRKVFKSGDDQQATKPTIETAPLSDDQLQVVAKVEISLNPPQFAVGSGQSVGRQRDHNEDTLFALTAVIADGQRDLPIGIFVVADGMGGHQHGEVASSAAARTMVEHVLTRLYPALFSMTGNGLEESIQEILEGGVKEAHRAVVRMAPGGGTTLTVALVVGEQVTVAHVGDSRGYFIYPDGRTQVMTQDHSLVRRLQELGQINEKEAMSHPQRNVLYRALGQPEPFRPDINTFQFPAPGYLLLCSDGLWTVVPDNEIFRIVTSAKSLPEACNDLVAAANEAGGPDNISVVLVKYLH
ncbi:MAG: serine/threonine-protein phosphatase [Anaerolineaceae bacterium]|nr:serine/threonine-protein phosphatase [Anaerolineaceae bacterium]